ncbi:MAG: 4-hydroxy-2-oxovalerate aldolase [Oligoflexia bacterium]|nr:4-hydroxy-2-oxovalerate aldolase [Oligoflexia bacterium]
MENNIRKKILITDPTLRDGSHANQHQFSEKQIRSYSIAAERARIPILEVGHGNGIGASSLQVGLSSVNDLDMIRFAREHLQNTKLGIFMIPGFATIKKDLRPAIDAGADVVRIASHCTEADITERHIGYARERGKLTHGCLMSSHMASAETLIEECKKMESYGAEGVILMDSAGNYLPSDVYEKVSALVKNIHIPIGFHAHNNLSMAVANSVAAVEAGALIVDGTSRGFGAGAGNTPIEVLVAVLEKMGYDTGIDLYKILDASEIADKDILNSKPTIDSTSIVSGLAGVFSAFKKHVIRVSAEYNVDSRDVFFELGRRKVVGGQEDLIVEIAIELSSKEKSLRI